MNLRAEAFPHRVLSVATPEARPLKTLTDQLGERGFQYSPAAVSSQMLRLIQAGFLTREAVREGCIRYRYALTPAGQAELSRVASPGPVYGTTARALLSVASGTPQIRDELVARLEDRGTYLKVGPYALNDQLGRLAHYGLLVRSGAGCSHHPFRYALTTTGEAELDRLWGQE